jgi:multimeric flavodoxin WrbA
VKVLVLSSSPRRDGNSSTMAQAAADGARQAGHEVDFAYLADHVQGLFRDCRGCRDPAGACTVGDDYETLLLERVVPAEGMVIATPLYWYGMSGSLKTFFDRLFCYSSGSADRPPGGDQRPAVLGAGEAELAIWIAHRSPVVGPGRRTDCRPQTTCPAAVELPARRTVRGSG